MWVPETLADRAPATSAAEAADTLAVFLTGLHRPVPNGAPTDRLDRPDAIPDATVDRTQAHLSAYT